MSITNVVASIIAVVFGIAALSKVMSAGRRDEFRAELASFGIRSRAAKRLLALAIPGLEFAIAVTLLAVVPLRTAGLVASCMLLVLFSLVLALRAVHSKSWHGPCGCFGSGPELPLGWHLGVNGTLIAVAVLALLAPGSDQVALADQLLQAGVGGVIGALIAFAGSLYSVARISQQPASLHPRQRTHA